jgi:hypothetical protein
MGTIGHPSGDEPRRRQGRWSDDGTPTTGMSARAQRRPPRPPLRGVSARPATGGVLSMMPARKDLLSGTPEEVSGILEELSLGMSLREYMGNTQLRSLAVELTKNHDLQVSVITYQNESQELEVTLAGVTGCDPVMIYRDRSGGVCQITCDLWVKIGTWPEIEKTAEMIGVLLQIRTERTGVKASIIPGSKG